MAKKKPKYNPNSLTRSAIRRVFSRSPLAKEVKTDARSEHDQYKLDGSLKKRKAVRFECANCGGLFKGTDVAVDHRIPVVDVVDGFIDWNEFYTRLWCSKDNLDVLCDYTLKREDEFGKKSCHYLKSQAERKARKEASAIEKK